MRISDLVSSRTVVITRRRSGFANVADTMCVGDYEHEGNAVVDSYLLPDNYTTDGAEIYDPEGYECAIVCRLARPLLISRAGPVTDQPLLQLLRGQNI